MAIVWFLIKLAAWFTLVTATAVATHQAREGSFWQYLGGTAVFYAIYCGTWIL